jgi:peptidoglycan hydrolase-like protein with peptidoglycan-binding domain
MTVVIKAADSLDAVASRWGSTVAAIRAATGPTADALVPGQSLVVPVRSPWTKYRWRTLRTGDHGAAVKALQTALVMPRAHRTGYFGTITRRYVSRLQGRLGWAATGRAGPPLWVRLGA